MSPQTRTYLRFLVVFGVLGVVGIAATAYLAVKQRAPVPFRDVYRVNAEFASADGVVSGIGQPVNVAGVNVGQVTRARVADGRALVTLQIKRDRVPRVYANATATLEPITPLKDMQINLDPGRSPASPLPDGATLRVGHTDVPVDLTDLLSVLDTDTRSFLTALIAGLDQGTRGRGPDMRRLLLALGPTTTQVGRIARSLARRRAALARLVHNLARVTRAASRDDRLDVVVAAGNQTLKALGEQNLPLRRALADLPPTLGVTRSTLVKLEPFARKLQPTLKALQPAVDRLPATLTTVRPFADTASAVLKHEVRPLVREAKPPLRRLGPALTSLSAATPDLSRSFNVLEYLANELAYNPPGDDEGNLFWLAWFAHNFGSTVSLADAHGGISRAAILATCDSLTIQKQLQRVLGLVGACPQ